MGTGYRISDNYFNMEQDCELANRINFKMYGEILLIPQHGVR